MARLVSVNVGLPRDIAWRGKTVHTAVWKDPVQGRRMVRRLNIDGDGQGDLGGHGGEQRAVFVYQIESYRYWQAELKRADFIPGQFGENFTIEGLPDDVVCIGDRYQIGGALFEVTQPRVTCYRVGIRMNEPRMPALLKASAQRSILELAEACDVPVRWSCRTGVCHSCESGFVSGEVVYGPEPLEKPADGNLLVCCSQPIQDVVIDL